MSSRWQRARARWQRVRGWFDGASKRTLFLVIFGPLLVVYLSMPNVWGIRSIDPFTNALTAHTMANDGTAYLDDYEPLAEEPWPGHRAWVIWGEERAVSQYPPGAAAHAVPAYLLWPSDTEEYTFEPVGEATEPSVTLETPSEVPADVTAALVTALAMAVLGLTFRLLVPGSLAVAAAYVAALGTSAWSVAAQELWQHGPAMLWIAVAGYALARARSGSAGAAYGVAILVRPLTAVIAVVPVALAVARRRWVGALWVSAGIAAGTGALVAYNTVVFGEPSISGGYGSDRADALGSTDLGWYLENIKDGLFHEWYGLLTWSPFLVLLFVGVGPAWRRAPDWVRGPAVGGFAYLAMNWLLNRASGGGSYYFYRYPLEALMAAAPLLLLAYVHWVQPRLWARLLFYVAVAFAVVAHGIAAM